MISPGLTIIIDWVCLLLTYIICGLRLAVRCTSKKRRTAKYHTEVILCLALAVATGSVSVNTWKNVQLMRAGRLNGVVSFRALEDVPPEEAILSLKLIFAQSFIYFVIVWLIKAAFISTYFHFRHKMTWACKIALYVLTAVVVTTFLTITLMMFLTCLPLNRVWSLGPDFCSPQHKIWSHSKTAAANIITDLFLIGLFLAILRTLHLGPRERWGIICFLSISAVPILAATLRLVTIIISLRPSRTRAQVQRFNDILYLASEIELTTAYIAACLPAMRVFIREKREEKMMRKGLRPKRRMGGEESEVEEGEDDGMAEDTGSESEGDAEVDASTVLRTPADARV